MQALQHPWIVTAGSGTDLEECHLSWDDEAEPDYNIMSGVLLAVAPASRSSAASIACSALRPLGLGLGLGTVLISSQTSNTACTTAQVPWPSLSHLSCLVSW